MNDARTEKFFSPPAPEWVGSKGEEVRCEQGTPLEGKFIWSDFWGWSLYVPKNPEMFQETNPGHSYSGGRPFAKQEGGAA